MADAGRPGPRGLVNGRGTRRRARGSGFRGLVVQGRSRKGSWERVTRMQATEKESVTGICTHVENHSSRTPGRPGGGIRAEWAEASGPGEGGGHPHRGPVTVTRAPRRLGGG